MLRPKVHPEQKHGILFESQKYVLHRKWKHTLSLVKGIKTIQPKSIQNKSSFPFPLYYLIVVNVM